MKLKVGAHQRGELFRFMETHFYSEEGQDLDVQKKKVLWNMLTPILNKIGPARDCARWRKFWSDTLLRVRKKIALRQILSYQNQLSGYSEKRKIDFTKEDLEVLRITGGEDKLIKEFRPRNKSKYSKINFKDLPLCIEDSNTVSTEFEVTNQPVSDDYYEFEKYDSKDSLNSLNSNVNSHNSNDITPENDEVENDDDADADADADDGNQITNEKTNLNFKPLLSSTESPNEIAIEQDTNTNHSNYSNNSKRKRRRNYNSMHSHSNSSNSPSMINDSQFIPECVTSFDIIEENDDNNYVLENLKKKHKKNNNTNNNNLLQDEPLTMCNTTIDYPDNFNNNHQNIIPPPLAPITTQTTTTTGTNQRITQRQHQQQFIANQMAYNEEMLNVQKETLMEMRKLSEAQLETNQLLKNLILMFGTNSSDMSNINEMSPTQLNDLSNIVIKGEK